jgi:hypothetical protein
MTKQEQAFWNYYDQANAIAEKHNVEIYQVVNFRQIWDYAYAVGKADGASEMMEIFKESK